jgi:hypothetical protein
VRDDFHTPPSHLAKAASLPGQNQIKINHEGHEDHEEKTFMIFMSFTVEYFLTQRIKI